MTITLNTTLQEILCQKTVAKADQELEGSNMETRLFELQKVTF